MQSLNEDIRYIRPADYINHTPDCQIEIAFQGIVSDVSVIVGVDDGFVPKDSILNTEYEYFKFDNYTDGYSQLGKLKATATLIAFLYEFITHDMVMFKIKYTKDGETEPKYVWFEINNQYVASNHNWNGE